MATTQEGQLAYQATFGFSDFEKRVYATNRSRYRTASVAKWFSASTAMRLVDLASEIWTHHIVDTARILPKKDDPSPTQASCQLQSAR
ncbi:MAG: hypothetical protein AAF662_15030 [Pseudomonadota bacterium]